MEPLRALRGGAGRRARPLLLLAAALAAGCGGGTGEPERLLDGSRAPVIPAALDSIGEQGVTTRVRVLPARSLDPRGRACFRSFAPVEVPPAETVVRRVGLAGASLTFRLGRFVYGCDLSAGATEHGRPWCGNSVGEVAGGRLVDPRLHVGCVDAEGRRLGFAWLEPARGARWVVVEEPGHTEVYEVAGGLPVRMTTERVDHPTSSATFVVVQYAADGRELARGPLRTVVAG